MSEDIVYPNRHSMASYTICHDHTKYAWCFTSAALRYCLIDFFKYVKFTLKACIVLHDILRAYLNFVQLQAFIDQRLKEMEDDTNILSSNQVKGIMTDIFYVLLSIGIQF